ncbi:MAG: cytochrome c biogenesis protein CcdA [Phycisphaerae bacterium]
MRHGAMLLAATLILAGAGGRLAAEAEPEPWLQTAAHLDHAALARGQTFRAAVVLDLDADYHVNATPPSLDFQIPTTVRPAAQEGITWDEVRYPEGVTFDADWAGDDTVRVYSGRTILVVPGTVADDAPLGPVTLRFTLAYQGCDASTCYQPGERTLQIATEIVAADAAPDPANADVFEAVRAGGGPVRRSPKGEDGSGRSSSSGPASSQADTAPEIRFEDEQDVAAWFREGFLVALPLLFLGGLGLNLTPCVFPLIPITMNVFAQQGESRPLKVLPLALVYVLGLALTFTLVGVLAALAGQSLGLVLQTPWGVLGVVVVLAIMMASAFGAFDIQLPSGVMGKLGGRQGVLGAGFMGMVMGAIAAPCVGPFLIGLLTAVATFATEHSTAEAIPLGAGAFFVVGIGLGVPYIFLGTFTGLINRFPRGGPWLVWTKRLLALALGGLILYFLRPYIAPAMFWPMVLALFVFAAVYMGLLEGLSRRPFSKTFWTVRIVAAVALLAGGIVFYATQAPSRVRQHAGTFDGERGTPSQGASADGAARVNWTAWQPGALEEAKAAGRGVLLYFGADWCTECFVWKRGLFSDPEVVAVTEDLERVYVDVTKPPPADTPKGRIADAYRGRNPPAVIVLDAAGEVVKAWRDPPDVDPFVAALEQAAGNI